MMKPSSETRPDFQSLVDRHYANLYRFAFSLTRSEPHASDLTQQAFYIWAEKGHQLQDASKAKSWLFTTLHREFLKERTQEDRFPQEELDEAAQGEAPSIEPAMIAKLDAKNVVEALGRLPEAYQAPLSLFYLQGFSYKEIAETLEIPVGTAQSRIARGKARLYALLHRDEG